MVYDLPQMGIFMKIEIWGSLAVPSAIFDHAHLECKAKSARSWVDYDECVRQYEEDRARYCSNIEWPQKWSCVASVETIGKACVDDEAQQNHAGTTQRRHSSPSHLTLRP